MLFLHRRFPLLFVLLLGGGGNNIASISTVSSAPSLPFPFRIVVVLPEKVGSVYLNPFRLFANISRPVIDIALDDVYARRILPSNDSLLITYLDSELSDARGPYLVIEEYCAGTVDLVLGFAYVFAMAPIVRMAQFWKHGPPGHEGTSVPTITMVGMQHYMDDKEQYKHFTRMMGSYSKLAEGALRIAQLYKWEKVAFFFESDKDQRTECEFQLLSIKDRFGQQYPSQDFDQQYVKFLKGQPADFKLKLSEASMLSNTCSLLQQLARKQLC